MTNVRSWRFWVIIALALATMACAARRERQQEAREARAERNEQKRAQQAERNEQRRAQREGRTAEAPASPPPAQAAAPAVVFTPISTVSTAAAAPADSKVVFLRATNSGSAMAASVFDVTDGEPKFIGIINRGNKLAYPVRAGLYTFMLVSDSADFMQATVIGGRTYYALVTPRMGASKALFSFKPVRSEELSGSQFAAVDRGTRLVANTPKTLAWAQDNAADIVDKRDRYLPEWTSKPASDRAAQTLNAEDGR
jgi:hypothetical protein